MKKLVILFCVVASCIFVMGCDTTEHESVLANEITGVFQTTVIPLPENYSVLNTASYDNGMFITDLFYTDDNGSSYYNDLNRKTLTFDTEGSVISITDAESTEDYISRWIFDDTQFIVKSDFSVSYVADEELIASIDLPALLHFDMRKSNRSDSAFSVLEILSATDDEYYILTTAGLVSVSASGKIQWTQTEINAPSDIVFTEYGLICLCAEDDNTLLILHEANGSVISQMEIPPQIQYGSGLGGTDQNISLYSGDAEFDFYAATEQAIFGITISQKEDEPITGNAIEWLNWLNSDINPKSVSNLCIADNTVTAIRSAADGKQLILLTKVPDHEIVPQNIISLAFLSEDLGMNNVILHAIENFNRSNSEYRIITTDFTIYEKDIRHTIFGAELASGNIPDIVILSTDSPQDTSVGTYVNGGIFCDLLPYMESNDSFDYQNILGYVTTPYITDGKQYVFPLTPSVATEFGSSAYFSGPLTIEETFMAIDELPDDVYWTASAVGFKRTTLQSIIYDFVDFQEGSCAFDSDVFTYAIQKMNEISDDKRITEVRISDEYFSIMQDQKLRLVSYAPNSLFSYAKLNFYLDGEAVAVGFPNQERKLYVENTSGVYFAVTEGSTIKDTAFDFINYVFSSMDETNYNEGNYAFFTHDIYRKMNEYINKTFVYENGTFRRYESNELPSDATVYFEINTSTAEKYIAFLNSISAVLPSDSPLYNIAADEFYGYETRAAKQTAEVIQSRAAIYMAEQYH